MVDQDFEPEHRSIIVHRSSSIDHRPSSIDHRSSIIVHRSSSIDHRPSIIVHHPSPLGRRESFRSKNRAGQLSEDLLKSGPHVALSPTDRAAARP
jgi:hypothetical protein